RKYAFPLTNVKTLMGKYRKRRCARSVRWKCNLFKN
ncbi:MAG: hypothetical protein ACI8VL_000398, partial [Bacteroidia bacterium]